MGSPAVDTSILQLLASLLQQPDLTEVKMRDRFATLGVSVCKSQLGQVLREMSLRRKQIAPYLEARHRSQRAAADIVSGAATVPPEKLIFLDNSGVTT